jgi:hypothetical protein
MTADPWGDTLNVLHVPLIDGRQPPGSVNTPEVAVLALGRMKKVTAEVPEAGFVLRFSG